jgi:uncharacterized protein (DUF2126 family)
MILWRSLALRSDTRHSRPCRTLPWYPEAASRHSGQAASRHSGQAASRHSDQAASRHSDQAVPATVALRLRDGGTVANLSPGDLMEQPYLGR